MAKIPRLTEKSWSTVRSRKRLVSKAGLDDDVTYALTRPFTPVEREAIERVETMRAACEADTREIVIIDYGAGSPGAERTPEQIESGVRKTQPIGEVCSISSKSQVWCEFLFRLATSAHGLASSSAPAWASRARTSGRRAPAQRPRAPGHDRGLAQSGGRRNGQPRQPWPHERRYPRGNVCRDDAVLEEMRPVDFIFIDGHHDEQATIGYFEQVRPWLADRNAIVFDDIDWSDGMRAAWAHHRCLSSELSAREPWALPRRGLVARRSLRRVIRTRLLPITLQTDRLNPEPFDASRPNDSRGRDRSHLAQ